MILRGTVDHEGLFIDICAGWPGRVHDARVFHNSGLNKKAERGELFANSYSQTISGLTIPGILIGDPAYPLRPWLMKPYINTGHLTPQQQTFNGILSKARVVVEHAFGRLKGRWRCLRNKLNVSIDDIPVVIGACCVLHNLCQTHCEGFDDAWLDTSSDCDNPQVSLTTDSTHATTSGENVRKALSDYLYSQ